MKLSLYEQKYNHAIENYELVEKQFRFTSHPRDTVKDFENGGTMNPVLGIENEQLVTFFALDNGREVQKYGGKKKQMLLGNMSTAADEQGKGYAKTALQLLPAFVAQNFPAIEKVILAVNEKNLIAQALYHKVGFIDTNRTYLGKKGMLLIYELGIEKASEIF